MDAYMFLGAHSATIDRNGRVTLPLAFAKALKTDSVFLSRWLDRSIGVFPETQWNLFAAKALEVPLTARTFVRAIFAGSYEGTLDSRNRIVIPSSLAEFANLSRSVLVLGVVTHMEIWDPATFNSDRARGGAADGFAQSIGLAQDERAMRLVRRAIDEYNGPYRSKTDAGVKHFFICHSSQDNAFVRRLALDLTGHGITVWFDEWEMLPGDSLYEKIQVGIREASWFGIVLSPDSVQSKWCRRELYSALGEEFMRDKVFVVPILYRSCDIPGFLTEKIYVDLSGQKYRSGFRSLLRRFNTGPRAPSRGG